MPEGMVNEAAAARLRGAGRKAESLVLDVGNPESIASGFAEVARRYGVRLAGDPERAARSEREQSGIWIDDTTWAEIEAAERKLQSQ